MLKFWPATGTSPFGQLSGSLQYLGALGSVVSSYSSTTTSSSSTGFSKQVPIHLVPLIFKLVVVMSPSILPLPLITKVIVLLSGWLRARWAPFTFSASLSLKVSFSIFYPFAKNSMSSLLSIKSWTKITDLSELVHRSEISKLASKKSSPKDPQ